MLFGRRSGTTNLQSSLSVVFLSLQSIKSLSYIKLILESTGSLAKCLSVSDILLYVCHRTKSRVRSIGQNFNKIKGFSRTSCFESVSV